MLNNYIDQVTDLIEDIDLRYRIREIVINSFYDGREAGLNRMYDAIIEIKKDKKL